MCRALHSHSQTAFSCGLLTLAYNVEKGSLAMSLWYNCLFHLAFLGLYSVSHFSYLSQKVTNYSLVQCFSQNAPDSLSSQIRTNILLATAKPMCLPNSQ